MLNVQLKTPPTTELLTLTQVKAWCEVPAGVTNWDTLLTALIPAARSYAETYCSRAFASQVFTLNLDTFPVWHWNGTVGPLHFAQYLTGKRVINQTAITLPYPTVTAVTSITYIDVNGVTQTLDPSQYNVDMTSEPARIVPVGGLFPVVQPYTPGAVQVTFTSGKYDASTLPGDVQTAMFLLISHWFSNRNASSQVNMSEIPYGVNVLLNGHKFEGGGWNS